MDKTTEEVREERRELYKKLYKKISQALNGDTDLFCEVLSEELQRDHRTLQQNFWRLIVTLAEKYTQANFDLRNGDSVTLCRRITELEERYLPHV